MKRLYFMLAFSACRFEGDPLQRSEPLPREVARDCTVEWQPEGDMLPWHFGQSMIFDRAHQRFVLFAGAGLVFELPLGADHWTRLSTFGRAPRAARYFAAVADPERDRMIIHGGIDNAGEVVGEVWALSFGDRPTWAMLSGDGPRLLRHTLIRDPVRDRLILFGGIGPSRDSRGEAWSMELSSADVWERIDADPALRARFEHSAIYDPTRRRMIVFGGASSASDPDHLGDVWSLSLDEPMRWTAIATAGAPRLGGHFAAHEPATDAMLVVTPGERADVQLWRMSLGSATWERVVARVRWPKGVLIAAAFEDGRTVVHSSRGSWSGTVSGEIHWDQVAQRPRTIASYSFNSHAFYDAERESIVALSLGWFFGDRISTRRLDEPEWTTTEVPTALDYDPAFDPAIYEPRGGRIMVLGWDSVPWTLSPWSDPSWRRFGSAESSPFPRMGHAVAFDPIFDRVLVIGGIEVPLDVWSLDTIEGMWSRLDTTDGPPIRRAYAATAIDAKRRRLILMGGTRDYGFANPAFTHRDVWTLSLDEPHRWTEFETRGFELPNSGVRALYDPIIDRAVVWIPGSEELHLLDLDSGEWSSAQPAGAFPSGFVRELVTAGDGHLISVAVPADDPAVWRIDLTALRCGD